MSTQQLDIFAGQEHVGVLGRSELQARTYLFNYLPQAKEPQAISLTMPVLPDQYSFQHGVHPIFQMNLPEGELREMLRNSFQKTVQHFGDLSLLGIVGHSQRRVISRWKYLYKVCKSYKLIGVVKTYSSTYCNALGVTQGFQVCSRRFWCAMR